MTFFVSFEKKSIQTDGVGDIVTSYAAYSNHCSDLIKIEDLVNIIKLRLLMDTISNGRNINTPALRASVPQV